MDGTGVEECARAAHGGEKLIHIRVIYRRGLKHAAAHVRHGDAAVVHAADEIHRTVNWVDDEDMLRTEIAVDIVLLAEEARAGYGGAQPLHQQRLHALVILRDDIAVPGLCLGKDAVHVHYKLRRLALGADDGVKYGVDIGGIHCVSSVFISAEL